MPKQVYINIPVSDLAKSTAFYEALGFTKNPIFSDTNATCLLWSEDIAVMLLLPNFYRKFLREKEVADTTKTSSVLLALPMETKEEVQKFADIAKKNGGDYFQVDMGVPADMMFGYEVEDPDGNTWEPMWMNDDFNPQELK